VNIPDYGKEELPKIEGIAPLPIKQSLKSLLTLNSLFD
jgi:hypothetical protein